MTHHIAFDLELKQNPYEGKYIAIEGIDASGKTTQVESLVTYFQKQKKEVVVVTEPSNKGVTGELIREILAGEKRIPLTAFQYIFTADRTIQYENTIIPALKEGAFVIAGRCFWSAIPYGVMDKGVTEYNDQNAQLLLVSQGILSMYHQFIKPDFTFYLKISADTACDRLSQMDKHKEIYEKKSKLEKLAQGYNWLAKKFPEEIVTIDGEQSIERVTEDILSHLKTNSL